LLLDNLRLANIHIRCAFAAFVILFTGVQSVEQNQRFGVAFRSWNNKILNAYVLD
jgi:hypothetical protein